MKINRFVFVLIFFNLIFFNSYSQISGCTDPQAINYVQNATVNDGSCFYKSTNYYPETFISPISSIVNETSGLIFFRGALWTHNDSGGKPEIYKIDTITGDVVQIIRIINATNVDWEDITQDSDFIYIGDFGNNFGNRDDLKVYKISKTQIPQTGDAQVEASVINFSYSDQKNFAELKNNNNFDCEAFFALNDSLYLFTKDWDDHKTRMYVLPADTGTYRINPVYTYNVKGLITGADINAEKNQITLVGYYSYESFIWLMFDFKGNDLFSGNKRRIDFSDMAFVQTEGIAYYDNRNVFMSCENSSCPQSLFKINTGIWTDINNTGVSETENVDNYDVKIIPNPVKDSFKIVFNNFNAKKIKLEIRDKHWRKLYHKKYHLLKNKENILSFNGLNYKPGMYFLKIKTKNKIIVKKLIIINH